MLFSIQIIKLNCAAKGPKSSLEELKALRELKELKDLKYFAGILINYYLTQIILIF